MNQILNQIYAVFRLEIGKTFLARRGLWIYLLAFAPLAIIGGHVYSMKHDRDASQRLAARTPGLTKEKFRQIKDGMTRGEVVAILGEPADHRKYTRRDAEDRKKFHDSERMQFSDGVGRLSLDLEDDKVQWHRYRGMVCDPAEDISIFAGIFQLMYIRLAVFFGCVFIFINLFRGEMLDKSLHYYFLAPVRREVVVVGKFLAGLTAATVIFVASEAVQIAVMNLHYDAAALDRYMNQGGGWRHAFSYLGVTALACVGYGSVFLAAGLLIRNPLIPAAAILGWEYINGVLPAALRKFSIIYYLTSLSPVQIPIGQNAPRALALLLLNVDPATPLMAIGGLVLLCLGILVLASYRVRRLEISYGGD